MTEPSTDLFPTPGQTVGPFFGQALPYAGDSELVPAGRADAVRLHGSVLDGDGVGVPDALVEIWQADASGQIPRQDGSLHRDGWSFTGWGRCHTDLNGTYSFSTVRPGAVGGGAAFWAVSVFARGLLDVLFTRIYVPGQDALAADPLLSSLPEEQRATLVATEEPAGYRHDLRLQGELETVFLAHRA